MRRLVSHREAPTDLTERQAEILAFIEGFIATYGYAPTLREIMARFGLRSTNGAADHVSALEQKGYVRRLRKSGRSLQVLKPTPVRKRDRCPTCGRGDEGG